MERVMPIYDGSFLVSGKQEDYLTVDQLAEQMDKFLKRLICLPEVEFPQVMFFIDKSARPIAYIFRSLFFCIFSKQEFAKD